MTCNVGTPWMLLAYLFAGILTIRTGDSSDSVGGGDF